MRREIKPRTGRLLDASDLTVCAPIKQGLVPSLDAVSYKTRAETVLRLLQLGRQGLHEFELTRVLSDAVERVGMIHAVRVGIIEPHNLVMLSVTFDGDWEPYMRVVWQKVSRLLDLIFCHTEDYVCGWESSYDDWMRWLRRRQVNTPFLYSQPGLTYNDGNLLRMQEWLQRHSADKEAQARLLEIPNADLVERQLSSGDSSDPRFPGSAGYATEHGGDFQIVRQSVRSLAALHRLTDLFLPGTHDGWVLHRAARETLATLCELADGGSLPYSEQLEFRFADAIAWLSRREPELPAARTAPPLQNRLSDVLPQGEWGDVQAGVLSPLKADHGCVLLLRFADATDLAQFLGKLALTDHAKPFDDHGISINLALSVEGLRLAGFSDDELRAWPDAFYEGMARRAGMLGDVHGNHPRRWRLPLRLNDGALSIAEPADPADPDDRGAARVELAEVHALLVLRLQRESQRDAKRDGKAALPMSADAARKCLIAAIEKRTHKNQRLALQWLTRLTGAGGQTTEHFGWRDAQTDPVFDKDKASSRARDHSHVGEALCGYANAADHRWPDAHNPSARWLRNGSFLVVRKLREDVAELRRAVHERVEPKLDADIVRAKLMGRWHDEATAGTPGAPLLYTQPPADRTNHFSFSDDANGELCPLHSHIRRSNPRQATGSLTNEPRDTSPQAPVRPPRLLRRSMSYGPVFDEKDEKSEHQDRGLFFMAYNACLAEQFEVLQRWLAGGNSSGGDSAQPDALLGVAAPGRDRTHVFHHDGKLHRVVLEQASPLGEEPRALVRLEWGAYWFVPALGIVRQIAERAAKSQPAPLWDAQRGEADVQALLELERREGAEAGLRAWKVALEDPESLLEHRASSIWAAIREFHDGHLRCAFGVLVGDPDGVHRVVRDAQHYSATGYQARMRNSFGTIFLGCDAGAADLRYERESAHVVDAIRKLPLGATYLRAKRLTWQRVLKLWHIAKEAAEDANDVEWRLVFDARELLDHLLGELCAAWFGVGLAKYFDRGGLDTAIGAGDKPRNPGNFASPSRFFFQPHPSAEVASVGEAHGQALRRAMQALLDSEDPANLKAMTAPLLRAVLDNPLCATDPGYAARTVVGVAMGFVPTVDGTIRRALGEWLREGTFWRLRGQSLPLAGYGDAQKSVQAELVRAIQLRAAPELLWRTARVDHVLGNGAHAVAVKEGDRVVAGLMSATQCHWQNGRDDYHEVFGGDRDQAGAPTHACPGTKAGFAVMLGFFAALLECPLPLRPGPVALSFEAVCTRERDKDSTTPFGGLARQRGLAARRDFSRPVKLLALGDSWLADGLFSLNSLTASLRERGYECPAGCNLASATLTLKAIANKAAQAATLAPDVDLVLLDGGGNDVHKKNPSFFETLTNPSWPKPQQPNGTAESTLDYLLMLDANGKLVLNEDAVKKFIDEYLAGEMERALRALVAEPDAPPVVVVAYDHPIPDGRGPLGGLGPPWLEPAFKRWGLDVKTNPQHLKHASGLMAKLIDRLNAMNKTVAAKFPGKPIHPIDLTGTLQTQDYKDHWSDELHPNDKGFDLLAERLIALLPSNLPKPVPRQLAQAVQLGAG